MVQNTAKRVFGCFFQNGTFHSFADCNAKAAWTIRVLFKDGLSRCGFGTGARYTGASPGFHHKAAVWFLIVAHFDHEYFAFHPKKGTGESKGTPPLAGTGFGIYLFGSRNFIVISLGNGCIGFMASSRTYPLIFKVYFSRSIQKLFKFICPVQWCGPPY